jgi:hypothetical protein
MKDKYHDIGSISKTAMKDKYQCHLGGQGFSAHPVFRTCFVFQRAGIAVWILR